MSVLAGIQQAMREVFANDELVIEPHMCALDIDGWDSLSHTLLILELERVFGVELDLDIVADCADIGALCDYIVLLK